MKKYNRGYSKWIVLLVCTLFVVMMLTGCGTTQPEKPAVTEPKPAEPTEPTEPKEPVEEVKVGDADAGLAYMKKSCIACHSVPARNNIKPYDRETGREFLAGHMIPSPEEELDNMIAFFFD